MIISPGRRFIFVHIPKTGGTSLAAALEARAMADDILIGDTPKAIRRRSRVRTLQKKTDRKLWKHSTLADIDGLVDLANYKVVTLVRNPWDRMVSYYHWLREQSFDHPAVIAAKALTFRDFVLDPAQSATIAAMPYSAYVRDRNGSERCDFFIRLEELATDVAGFEAYLGFAPQIGHLNASPRTADYRGYYDATLRDHVAMIARDDIQRFGYQF